MELDLEELAALFELLDGASFSEFRLDKGDLHILVRRGSLSADPELKAPNYANTVPNNQPATAVPTTRPAGGASLSRPGAARLAEATEDTDQLIVRSPILGTVYRAPRPGESNFVAQGDSVEAETILCIVEVMKLMNSVPAGVQGMITRIFVEDGDLVEPGAPLFAIRPTS